MKNLPNKVISNLPLKSEKGAGQILVVALVIVVVAAAAYFLANSGGSLTMNKAVAPKPKVQLASSYDLNLVGISKSAAPTTAANTIYLPTQGGCIISLTSGQQTVSSSGCNSSNTASFSLPSNSTGEDEATTYVVYFKTLDPSWVSQAGCKKEGTDTYCPTHSMLIVRGQDNSYTSDVTKLLDNVYVDLKGSGNPQRYIIFDDKLKDKVWRMDGDNRLVQLRFYPQSTQALEQQDAQD
jgi:hypothetical protein